MDYTCTRMSSIFIQLMTSVASEILAVADFRLYEVRQVQNVDDALSRLIICVKILQLFYVILVHEINLLPLNR